MDHCGKKKTWFSKRDYPDKIIENEMKRVNFGVSRCKIKSAKSGLPLLHINPQTQGPRQNYSGEFKSLIYE